MADRRVKYILEVDYEGGTAALQAADDLREVDDAARQAEEGLTQAEGGFSKFQASVVTMGAALGLAQQGFQALSGAVQGAWGALEEGAAIQDTRDDFEALAATVGSTGDSMANAMREASGGMLTEMQAIGSASELMLLNMGLAEDQIVDLVGVAGELGWSMEAVSNAINTQSTRSLKELGLGIGDVKAKVAELEAAGYALDEAFTLAILDAGRERIELVGGASETAAGKMVMATNAITDYKDSLKESIVISLEAAGAFDALAGAAERMSMGTDLREMIDQYEELTGLRWTTPGGLANMDLEELEAEWARLALAIELAGTSSVAATNDYVESSDALVAGNQRQSESSAETARAYQWLIDQYGYAARAADMVADAQMRASQADYTRAQSLAETTEAQIAAAEAGVAWLRAIAELETRGGDVFGQIAAGGASAWELGDAIYHAADAANAGAPALSQIGVQTKQWGQDTADLIMQQTQQQLVIDNLANAAANGIIPWETYYSTVNKALGMLDDFEAEPVAPPMFEPPEGVDWESSEFATAYQTWREEVTRPVAMSVETKAAMDAVDAAKTAIGEVDALEPEIMMGMDILAVRNGTGEVQRLMDELPTSKDITINLTVTGMALIEELRSQGVLP